MLNIVFERKGSMKSTIIAIIFLGLIAVTVAFGCASECPGYYREEEEGYIRCSVENPGDAAEDWISIRCSVVERDEDGYPLNADGDRLVNGYPVDENFHIIEGGDGIPVQSELDTCCVFGPNLSDRECMEYNACVERLDKIAAKTNLQTCDEGTDCVLLYGNEPDPADRKVVCCAAWVEDLTECRLPEDCVYDGSEYFHQCLSTWQCEPGLDCIQNVYMDDLYYCKHPDDM